MGGPEGPDVIVLFPSLWVPEFTYLTDNGKLTDWKPQSHH